MIYDSLDNLHLYKTGHLWESISNMALSLNSTSEDGIYPIEGEIAYCRVMQYSTKQREQCRIEGHRKYIDIQFTLKGAEGIDIFRPEEVKIKEAYSAKKDVEFYTSLGSPRLCTQNHAGFFTLLFPHDIHRPQLIVSPHDFVKKAVIKLEYKAFL